MFSLVSNSSHRTCHTVEPLSRCRCVNGGDSLVPLVVDKYHQDVYWLLTNTTKASLRAVTGAVTHVLASSTLLRVGMLLVLLGTLLCFVNWLEQQNTGCCNTCDGRRVCGDVAKSSRFLLWMGYCSLQHPATTRRYFIVTCNCRRWWPLPTSQTASLNTLCPFSDVKLCYRSQVNTPAQQPYCWRHRLLSTVGVFDTLAFVVSHLARCIPVDLNIL